MSAYYQDGLYPALPTEGMTSVDLADYIEALCTEARERIIGTGDEQYSEAERQRFEQFPAIRLYTEFREELLDSINYLAMLDITMRRALSRFITANPGMENHLG